MNKKEEKQNGEIYGSGKASQFQAFYVKGASRGGRGIMPMTAYAKLQEDTFAAQRKLAQQFLDSQTQNLEHSDDDVLKLTRTKDKL